MDTFFVSECGGKGKGVIAKRAFTPGAIVCNTVGELQPWCQMLNHSCEPNIEIALRDGVLKATGLDHVFLIWGFWWRLGWIGW